LALLTIIINELGINIGFILKTNIMKYLQSFLLVFAVTLLNSCSVVEGIFKAGMWWGIILVVGVVGLIIYLITRGGSKK
jgi:cytosine/uracil/thiamine/allantoin permease